VGTLSLNRFRPDPRLADVPAYVPGRRAPTDEGNLASNELPFGPSPAVLDALRTASQTVHRYPDPLADALRAVLADEVGVERDQILVANGSDELIYLLVLALDPATARIACADPPYQLHQLVPRIFRIDPTFVPLAAWRHDIDAFAKAEADVAIICNPHNPAGTSVSRQKIARLVKQSPETAVVVDEAYIEFADDPTSLSAVSLVGDGGVIVLRSLSKSLGLAGLRIAYLVGPSEVVAVLRKIRPPFSVNSLAQAAAVAALGDTEFRARARSHVLAMRPKLASLFSSHAYESIESQANFVLVITPDESAFCEGLRAGGVSVRPGSTLGAPGTARVSVPSDEGFVLLERALAALARNGRGRST
jgi:histidinol-phosphate aminotransferase